MVVSRWHFRGKADRGRAAIHLRARKEGKGWQLQWEQVSKIYFNPLQLLRLDQAFALLSLEIKGSWRVKSGLGWVFFFFYYYLFSSSGCFRSLAYSSATQSHATTQQPQPAMQELDLLVLPLKAACHNRVPSVSLISMSCECSGVHRRGCKGLNFI